MIREIKFSYNWNNKLAGKYFTTLRLKDVNRWIHDEVYDIILIQGKERKFLCRAQITAIRNLKLEEINEFIAGIDTGYSAHEAKEMIKTMYKNIVKDWSDQYLSFILLKKLDNRPAKKYPDQQINFNGK